MLIQIPDLLQHLIQMFSERSKLSRERLLGPGRRISPFEAVHHIDQMFHRGVNGRSKNESDPKNQQDQCDQRQGKGNS